MKVTIPETLNEITVEQFQKFDKANKSDDEEFVLHKLISIFCGVSMREVLNIRLEDAEAIAEDIAEVLESEGRFERRFEHNGKEWGFIPNLEEISLGEFIDLDSYLKDTETLHKALAVLYRPVTKKHKDIYSIESYEGSKKYSDDMKTVPLGIATGATLFFYRLGNELLQHSSHSLAVAVKETLTTRQKGNSQPSTDGFKAYTSLLEEMLRDLNKSQKKS